MIFSVITFFCSVHLQYCTVSVCLLLFFIFVCYCVCMFVSCYNAIAVAVSDLPVISTCSLIFVHQYCKILATSYNEILSEEYRIYCDYSK